MSYLRFSRRRILPLALVLSGAACSQGATASPPVQDSGAWFEEDWEAYADRAELAGTYHVGLSGAGADGDVAVVTGLTGTPGGFTRAVEVRFHDISAARSCGYEPGAGVVVPLPDAARDRPDELWLEVPIYLAPGYTTNHGCNAFSEHKFLFLFDQRGDNGRWNVMMGSAGSELRVYPNADPGGVLVARVPGTDPSSFDSPRLDIDSELVGTWSTMRLRTRLGPDGTGLSQLWIDGVMVLDDRGLSTDPGSQYFQRISLGANMNQRPASPVMWRYGPLKVYIEDPGW
ncbi:MAG: hypothetical protein RJQ04_14215 [Longimicrobiales bacterium]